MQERRACSREAIEGVGVDLSSTKCDRISNGPRHSGGEATVDPALTLRLLGAIREITLRVDAVSQCAAV